ncbi:MAG: dihydrofolate reductase [Saprospiraceae bacterium]|nr:MAG: dihydrofolate reductase [Saprospiraceae bacterium]
MQRISLIAAMSENRVIGNHNHLPWHLPDDWKNFRKVTDGKAFLMGRKSYQAEDALVSDYRNIIVTSKEDLDLCSHCQRAENLPAAFEMLANEKEFFILGGGSIFEQTIDNANYLYLTIVHQTFSGDAFFPAINWNLWNKVKSVYHEADEQHAFAFSLNEYERKSI